MVPASLAAQTEALAGKLLPQALHTAC